MREEIPTERAEIHLTISAAKNLFIRFRRLVGTGCIHSTVWRLGPSRWDRLAGTGLVVTVAIAVDVDSGWEVLCPRCGTHNCDELY